MNSIRNRVYAGEIAGGADTVEYVIVAIVAVIIGAALIAFGNQMQQQMTKTGNSISSWFESAPQRCQYLDQRRWQVVNLLSL